MPNPTRKKQQKTSNSDPENSIKDHELFKSSSNGNTIAIPNATNAKSNATNAKLNATNAIPNVAIAKPNHDGSQSAFDSLPTNLREKDCVMVYFFCVLIIYSER